MDAAEWRLRDGTAVTIRPIDPSDEPLMVKFHQTLSDRSVYLRYFHLTRIEQRIRHERLSRICTIEPGQEMAIVAVHSREDGTPEIIGVGRLMRMGDRPAAEVALLVSDAYQGKGLGTELMRRLLVCAREEGIEELAGDILAENESMMAVARRTGFTIRSDPHDPKVVRAALTVAEAGRAASEPAPAAEPE